MSFPYSNIFLVLRKERKKNISKLERSKNLFKIIFVAILVTAEIFDLALTSY